MEAVMPYDKSLLDNISEYGSEIGFKHFASYKFDFVMTKSDLDVFELMQEERLDMLLYGWEKLDEYLNMNDPNFDVNNIPESGVKVLKVLTYHTLHCWFSNTWNNAKETHRIALIYSVQQAKGMLEAMMGSGAIKWDYLLSLDNKPWDVPYLHKILNTVRSPDNAITVETLKSRSINKITQGDLDYLCMEGLHIILLRVIKLFDESAFSATQELAIRTIGAWLVMRYQEYKTNSSLTVTNSSDKQCLIALCHMYIMTVFETDNEYGIAVDNLMNNIRYYREIDAIDSIYFEPDFPEQDHKPARLIALIAADFAMNISDFCEAFILKEYQVIPTTLFGVIFPTFKRYVLENMLVEMYNSHKENFKDNFSRFSRILKAYIGERECSEQLIANELRKIELQKNSNKRVRSADMGTDFETKIAKGNRYLPITMYSREDEFIETVDLDCVRRKEKPKPSEPVFQRVPNNQKTLEHIYETLIPRTFEGWRVAKIIVLLRIITQKLNNIEMWRYHPGLSPSFMLDLDVEMSNFYEIFANLFKDFNFIHQEFCLTQFYLNPNRENYTKVVRCAQASKRSRGKEQNDATSNSVALTIKFSLLSSTVELDKILNTGNFENPIEDYQPLRDVLATLNLDNDILRDILSVIFIPRNIQFNWALPWETLRIRCKRLYKNKNEKQHYTELNMSEACEKLKFLDIDYSKYKNRPPMDYGTVERGYEGNLMTEDYAEDDVYDTDDSDEEEEREQHSSGDESDDESLKKNKIPDEYFSDTRRTRASTAAAIMRAKEEATQSTSPVSELEKSDATEFTNSTEHFKSFPNIWNQQREEVVSIEAHCYEKTANKLVNLRKLKNKISDGSPVTTEMQDEVDTCASIPPGLGVAQNKDPADIPTSDYEIDENDDSFTLSSETFYSVRQLELIEKEKLLKKHFPNKNVNENEKKRLVTENATDDIPMAIQNTLEEQDCLVKHLDNPEKQQVHNKVEIESINDEFKDEIDEIDNNMEGNPSIIDHEDEVTKIETKVFASKPEELNSVNASVEENANDVKLELNENKDGDNSSRLDIIVETNAISTNVVDCDANGAETCGDIVVPIGTSDTSEIKVSKRPLPDSIDLESHKRIRMENPNSELDEIDMKKSIPEDDNEKQLQLYKAQHKLKSMRIVIKPFNMQPEDTVKYKDIKAERKSSTPTLSLTTKEKLDLCKPFSIKLRRLSKFDVHKLRQPRVMMKRLNLEDYFKPAKVRGIPGHSSDDTSRPKLKRSSRLIKKKSTKRLNHKCCGGDSSTDSEEDKKPPVRRRKHIKRNGNRNGPRMIRKNLQTVNKNGNNGSGLNVPMSTFPESDPLVVRTFNSTFIQISSFSSSDEEAVDYEAVHYPLIGVAERDPLFMGNL